MYPSSTPWLLCMKVSSGCLLRLGLGLNASGFNLRWCSHPFSKATFIRLRKRGQSKHILGGMKVDWKLMDQNLWTTGPTVLDREALYKHLFLNRKCSMSDEVSKGHNRNKWDQWNYHRYTLWHTRRNLTPQMALNMSSWIL